MSEVSDYRTHHWECQRCGNVVKRATNRPPQEGDCGSRGAPRRNACTGQCAYHQHKRQCGADTYIKIAQPQGYVDKRKKKGMQGVGRTTGSASSSPPAKRPATGSPDERNRATNHFFKTEEGQGSDWLGTSTGTGIYGERSNEGRRLGSFTQQQRGGGGVTVLHDDAEVRRRAAEAAVQRSQAAAGPPAQAAALRKVKQEDKREVIDLC